MVSPQTAVVFGGGLLQSGFVQQPAIGMHAPLHILKPLAHGKLHVLAVPQVPVVLGGPPVQSGFEQQPAIGTQRLVPGHGLKLVLQEMPQVPPTHVAAPFAGGVGHDMQVMPQKLELVSDWQMPLQLCCPAMHMPLHAFAFGMHPPRHSLLPVGQVGTQARPSQVTMPPPVGV